MTLLLHTCCATCLLGVTEDLLKRSVDFTAYFFNPNVHPLIEWRRRLKATRVVCEIHGMPLEVDEEYGLVGFVRLVVNREESPLRCEVCYRLRLGKTALRARELGFDVFSTTMLASVEQDLELIRRISREVSEEVGVDFVDADWRNTHDRSKELARKMSVYRQQYCGCVYSEYDRYKDTNEHLYRGG